MHSRWGELCGSVALWHIFLIGVINISSPEQNGWRFVDDDFKIVFEWIQLVLWIEFNDIYSLYPVNASSLTDCPCFLNLLPIPQWGFYRSNCHVWFVYRFKIQPSERTQRLYTTIYAFKFVECVHLRVLVHVRVWHTSDTFYIICFNCSDLCTLVIRNWHQWLKLWIEATAQLLLSTSVRSLMT